MPEQSTTTPVDSYVYFIQAQVTGLIKIGYSVDPRMRLINMATMSPEPLVLLAIHPGGRDLEGQLHRRFSRSRTHGEWFRPTRGILDFIASAREQISPPKEFEMISARVASKRYYMPEYVMERMADAGILTRFKRQGKSWFNEAELLAYVEQESDAWRRCRIEFAESLRQSRDTFR